MSGNVFIICLTIIICAGMLAFCHYQEHQCDISDDRYQYLCGLINDLKHKHEVLQIDMYTTHESMDIINKELTALKEELATSCLGP